MIASYMTYSLYSAILSHLAQVYTAGCQYSLANTKQKWRSARFLFAAVPILLRIEARPLTCQLLQ